MAAAPPLTKRSRSRSRWPALGSDVLEEVRASEFSDVIRGLIEPFGRQSEDFDPILRNPHRMFELRRQRAVARHRGPAIAEDFDAIIAQIDHRLDGEEHAGLQRHAMSRLAVMHDVGQGMENAST